jgi:hypothetical protein
MIEEQKQQIKQLQEELAEFNCVQYRKLPANASRGKNDLFEVIKEGEYDPKSVQILKVSLIGENSFKRYYNY